MRIEDIPELAGTTHTVLRSYNRLVAIVMTGGVPALVVKVLGTPEHCPLTHADATRLCGEIEHYRDQLENLGVTVPARIKFAVRPNGVAGHFMIVESGLYTGETIHELLATASWEFAHELVKALLGSIAGLFSQMPNPDYAVGIDLVPRNFTFRDGRACYVDFHRAKLCVDGEHYLEWPEPTDPAVREVSRWRHYHPTGLLRVLFIQLCRIRPEWYGRFAELVREFATEVGVSKDIAPYVSADATVACEFKRIYDLRLFACQQAARGAVDCAGLERFFRATHFQREALSREQIARALLDLADSRVEAATA